MSSSLLTKSRAKPEASSRRLRFEHHTPEVKRRRFDRREVRVNEPTHFVVANYYGSGEPSKLFVANYYGWGEPAAPRRQSLLRSQARCALLPAATPRDVVPRTRRVTNLVPPDPYRTSEAC